MIRLATAALAAALLSGSAMSQNIAVTLTGDVLSNSYSSGPFAGAMSGDIATLSFEVATPGSGLGTGFAGYAIDLPTFDIDINGSTGAALGGATTLNIQNDLPVSDGFRIFQTQLVGGYFFTCEFGTGGGFFNSDDITQLAGVYDAAGSLTSFGYTIQGQGGFMEIFPQTLTIAEPVIGLPYCFCDGSGTGAPCANNGAAGNGCANGSNAAGANLMAVGSASASASTVVLTSTGTPSEPGLFFQGDLANNGGLGVIFGDGLRCAGGNVVRLETVFADASGTSSTGIDIAVKGGVSAGQTRYYQHWYRDPAGSPCGSFFNLTNGVEITWGI